MMTSKNGSFEHFLENPGVAHLLHLCNTHFIHVLHPLLYFCHTLVTLLLHLCCTLITYFSHPLLHICNTRFTHLLHPLLYLRYTVVTLISTILMNSYSVVFCPVAFFPGCYLCTDFLQNCVQGQI